MQKVWYQTASVPCKDVETMGGAFRARICANGTTALCEFGDYLNGTNGTCTLKAEPTNT